MGKGGVRGAGARYDGRRAEGALALDGGRYDGRKGRRHWMAVGRDGAAAMAGYFARFGFTGRPGSVRPSITPWEISQKNSDAVLP